MSRKTNNQLLIEAGRKYIWDFHEGGPGVRVLKTGKSHKYLEVMSLRHAKYQARVMVQGHQNWEQRFHEILAELPKGFMVAENAAESWKWNSRVEAATEAFHSWEQSPGHWATCNRRCTYFGINMSKGKNGIWYVAMLVAWK